MKCNQDLFETLFQTAQKPLVMECSLQFVQFLAAQIQYSNIVLLLL